MHLTLSNTYCSCIPEKAFYFLHSASLLQSDTGTSELKNYANIIELNCCLVMVPDYADSLLQNDVCRFLF